ncbi:short-chain dehydrogenase/reductase SDR [Shewanella denitrificans OS217]|uniref:Short-chain dehydrogenase/reductase SDR n=1 Tax=Shewanella denitrificans (strain OS217 / ATCC BAA-1090 / DSM 15013) TaxID=318161 RepID=Q12JJ3_SHEDO|nr:SDR family oxidoreductase [Shewanella denitrificans]ABE56383.1 short-chain dehydrogenase/reductase SDR [Shewanella denitrificans OS217]
MRHVIVSGGSRGLGLGIVKYLLKNGYMVSTCSRNKTDEISELEKEFSQLRWFKAEIGNAEQTSIFVKDACNWAGDIPLWGVVNNAGIAKEGVLATFPNTESDALIQVNLNGALYLARDVLRVFLRQRSAGRIINISSIIGSRGYAGLAAYSASKAGLDGLTRALARENGRRGITVNSVAPGYLETEMSSTLSEQKRNQIIRRTPINRLGFVDDITPAIGFLLSEDANFITGQTLIIDGGITN